MPVTKIRSRWNRSGYEGGLDFYSKASGNSVMTIMPGGVVFPNPSGGVDYHVDLNAGADANDGLGWGSAFASVTVALAASHANIAASTAGYAARNRIFIKGDPFEEDLELLARKTDIIGVGSHNTFPKPCIIGNHAVNGTSWEGPRFFNVIFKSPDAGGDLFTIPTTTRGIEFYDCYFDAAGADANAGGAVIATAVWFLKIIGCQFDGYFSDAVIELGAGNTQGLVIDGNLIHGANMGIDVDGSLTTTPAPGYILNNVFKTTLACINDASDKLHIIGNRGITLASKSGDLSAAVVGNKTLGSDNRFSCANEGNQNIEWPKQGSYSP